MSRSHCQLSVVENLFDCIVTDPPYGIRAGAKKSGEPPPFRSLFGVTTVAGRHGEPIVIPEERRAGLIPCTQHYPVEEVMLDLLHMSAISLKKSASLPPPPSLSLLSDILTLYLVAATSSI
jgi:tRNA G10  N-methylase Trm11